MFGRTAFNSNPIHSTRNRTSANWPAGATQRSWYEPDSNSIRSDADSLNRCSFKNQVTDSVRFNRGWMIARPACDTKTAPLAGAVMRSELTSGEGFDNDRVTVSGGGGSGTCE